MADYYQCLLKFHWIVFSVEGFERCRRGGDIPGTSVQTPVCPKNHCKQRNHVVKVCNVVSKYYFPVQNILLNSMLRYLLILEAQMVNTCVYAIGEV